MKNDNVFITGPPRSGKSTLVDEVINGLDLEAEGLCTPDIREGGKRKGFKLKDVKTGEEGILAHVDQEEGPKVSRYRVDMEDLERFTEMSLETVSEGADIVVIDEIGTMELFSDRFKEAVIGLLEGDKPVLAVLHRNQVDEFGRYGEVIKLERDRYEVVKARVMEGLRDMLDVRR